MSPLPATWLDAAQDAGRPEPYLPALKACFAAASGLVLFDKRCRFRNRIDGADARIGRMMQIFNVGAQKITRSLDLMPSRLGFVGFFRCAAQHGVTQKPTL
jgi:hypothetical protein